MRNHVSPLNGPANSTPTSSTTRIFGGGIGINSNNSASGLGNGNGNGFGGSNLGGNYGNYSQQAIMDGRRLRNTLTRRSGLDIPLDVLFLIFVECDPKSLITCRLVSQKPAQYDLSLSSLFLPFLSVVFIFVPACATPSDLPYFLSIGFATDFVLLSSFFGYPFYC
jgi:hypothetical protein